MLHRHIAILLVFAMFFAACNLHRREDAIKLSNELTQVNDSLNYFGKVWGDEFKVAVKTRDFTHLQNIRQKMEVYINQSIQHVNNLKDVGASKPLKSSLIDILKYEKDTILSKLIVFEAFTENTDDTVISGAYKDMMSTTLPDLKKHDVMYNYLDEYAEKNDFPKPVDK